MTMHSTPAAKAIAVLPAVAAFALTLGVSLTAMTGEATAGTKRCSNYDRACRISGYPSPVAPKPDPGGQQQR